mgnify:CR=1 FL=1
MTYNITIDARERELKEHFESNDCYTCKNIDIGDILFYINDDLKLIIERKTICDLYSSIKDGRYHEQKKRLFDNFDRGKIIYLLEGNILKNRKRFNIDIVYGSIMNTLLRDNIKIIFSEGLSETIKFISIIEKRLKNNPEFFENNNSNNTNDVDYCSTIKLKKKDNLTPQRTQLLQLAQIPGVSVNIAKVILEKYETLSKLMDFLKQEDLSELINLKNNNRKIGPKISSRLKEYLLS